VASRTRRGSTRCTGKPSAQASIALTSSSVCLGLSVSCLMPPVSHKGRRRGSVWGGKQSCGACVRVLRAWREWRLEVMASEATLREAELVLGGGWPAGMMSREDVGSLLEALRSQSVWVEHPHAIPTCG